MFRQKHFPPSHWYQVVIQCHANIEHTLPNMLLIFPLFNGILIPSVRKVAVHLGYGT
jgi:hypothetical protein